MSFSYLYKVYIFVSLSIHIGFSLLVNRFKGSNAIKNSQQ